MTFPTNLRGRISSPLEAGPSIVDDHHLPSQVNEALEYASRRLGRKASHITLLVVRRDYQLPTSPTPSPTYTLPGSLPLSTTTASTPSKPSFPAISRIDALKQLVRSHGSGEAQIRERIVHVHLDRFRNGTVSPAFSEASTLSASTVSSSTDSTFSHRVRWPGSPAPYGSAPVTPATPFTAKSSLSGTDGTSSLSRAGTQTSTQFGLRLVYAYPLSPREEKALASAFEKAVRKFKLAPDWLPQAVPPSTLGLPVDLVLNSTVQNEALFESESLTLLSLDHLYTFRTALQAYARTRLAYRLEDAVHELRRLFLANGRRALRKSTLLAAYRWLDPINDAALADVCHMYERAYGGTEKESGVENDVDPASGLPSPESKKGSEIIKQRMAGRRPDRITDPPRRREPQREPELKQEPKPDTRAPTLYLTETLDKEVLLSTADLYPDDQSELDEIEAWYREILPQQRDVDGPPMVEIHPSQSNPHMTTSTATPAVEVRPATPPTPPPPPPTSATYRGRPWNESKEPSLSEMLRTTPKIHPAPPGRSLGLKVQTTFDKPAKGGRGGGGGGSQQQPRAEKTAGEQGKRTGRGGEQQRREKEEEEEEEEEQLTARPQSAIKPFANARWMVTTTTTTAAAAATTTTAAAMTTTTTATATAIKGGNNDANGGMSIDEMLYGAGGAGFRTGECRPPSSSSGSSSSLLGGRIGPVTPNGYDDISPITQGEWRFLMFGKGRTARVETC
ncbi:hypothetical protein VTH82DRAFT_899 [Thermothelomyces myriococcoides]